MAKAMNDLDVVKMLLRGGYICRKEPPVCGRIEFTVHSEYGAQRGHITERKFCKMMELGIIYCNQPTTRDKNGNIYNFYFVQTGAENRRDSNGKG